MDNETTQISPVDWLQFKLKMAAKLFVTVELSALLVTAASIAGLSLAVYAFIDILVKFPAVLRVMISLFTASSISYWIYTESQKRLKRFNNCNEIARAIELEQERKGQSQNSLVVSALEFGEKHEIPGAVYLKNAAISMSRNKCVDPMSVKLYSKGRVHTAIILAAVTVPVILLWMFFAPSYFSVFMKRVIGLNADYPTRTKLVEVEWKKIAAAKKDYTVAVKIAGKIPAAGKLTIKASDRPSFEIQMNNDGTNRFVGIVPSPQKSFSFKFSLGDYASEKYHVDIKTPPAIKEGIAEITPPAYMQSPNKKSVLGNLSVPEGSKVKLSFIPTMPINEGSIIFSNCVAKFAKSGDSYVFTTQITDSTQFEISMLSKDGIENIDRIPFRFDIIKDEAPVIELNSPKANSSISPASTMLLEGTIKDDYGLSTAMLSYDIYQKRNEQEVKTSSGSFPITVKGRTFDINLIKKAEEMKVAKDDKLVIRITSQDNKAGGSLTGSSGDITITVLSPEELKKLILDEQTRMAALMDKLKEDEKGQADAIRRRLGKKETAQ